MRSSGDITVTQIAKSIQLSKTTIWKTIDHLLQQNMIINVGKAASSEEGGKKPELYRFNADYGYVISIAVYGNFILMTLADSLANMFYKEKLFIQENESLDNVVSIVASFIEKWQNPENLPKNRKNMVLLGIVLALTGVIDSKNGLCITASRFTSWPPNTPIRDLIQEKVICKADLYLDNNNRYFAFAEKTVGGYENYQNIIDIVAGHDGLGAGIIVENKIERGPKYLSGEIGHMCLNPFDDETCHCGGKGCFEQLVSIERLLKKAKSLKGSYPDSIISKSEEITLPLIFQSANDGDQLGRMLVDEIITWFAIGINNVSLVFNPEVIIISGDYAKAGDYFLTNLRKKVDMISLTRMMKNFEIHYSTFDSEGSAIGGACFVLNDFFQNKFVY